ncbi:unnamed protein product [Polarella glacialis]|uniref:Uncharacterized protein n=1 Tax=Polarella glacialis TaxID=89957 RepID=A0A813DQR4_POLGL|nr:unnamed protein product [Polarella glacialis]
MQQTFFFDDRPRLIVQLLAKTNTDRRSARQAQASAPKDDRLDEDDESESWDLAAQLRLYLWAIRLGLEYVLSAERPLHHTSLCTLKGHDIRDVQRFDPLCGCSLEDSHNLDAVHSQDQIYELVE